MLRNPYFRRRAFSLVELLVVIAIITLLVGLGGWAMFAMRGVQHRRNSESTVTTVNKLLQTRWAAVIADARKESPSFTVMTLAGGDMDRARVIWTKVRLAEAFPVSFAEIDPTNANSIVNRYIPSKSVKPHFIKYRQTITTYPASSGSTEPAACLLMALRTLQADGVSLDDQLKYAIKDTNNDGYPELVDAWNRPLGFFRFAWNHPALQASVPGGGANKFADPIDNFGKLITATWLGQPQYIADFHQTQNGTNATYVVPVIVSAGRDGKFGLKNSDPSGNDIFPLLPEMSPTPSPTPGCQYEADNIYSFQLAGG